MLTSNEANGFPTSWPPSRGLGTWLSVSAGGRTSRSGIMFTLNSFQVTSLEES